MIQIETERLKLIPLDHEMLSIWKNYGRIELEKFLKLCPANWELEDYYQKETQHALETFWHPETKNHFIDFFWYTNWEIILKDTNQSIGGIGFNGRANSVGQNEIGYLIEKNHRNAGYATEALERMIQWAFQDENLKSIVAKTHLDNLESQQVLLKNGFIKLENQDIDKITGKRIINFLLGNPPEKT